MWVLRMGLISWACFGMFALLSMGGTGGLKNESLRFWLLMLILAPIGLSALGVSYAVSAQRNWMWSVGLLLCIGILVMYGTFLLTIYRANALSG